MKDTEFECMEHGWRSTYQVCPFCMIMVLESDLKDLKDELAEAQSSAEAWHDNCNIMEAALDKEREKHAATVGRLAEARAEVARLKLGMTKDYCDGCWSLQRVRREAARECIEAIEAKYGILGLAFTLRQNFGLDEE